MDSEVGDCPTEEKAYAHATPLFWDALPNYLAIGMSNDEFWHGAPRLARAYKEAHKIRKDNRAISEWRQGLYFHEALIAASKHFREFSKGCEYEYPSEPFEMLSKPDESQNDPMEQNKARFLAMVQNVNRKLEGEEPPQ